jgi:hypothetical protein
MFKEIAVDPVAVASSYLQLNHLIDRFGIPEGRLIAAFPSKWKRLAYEAAKTAHAGHLDLKRIVERLNRLPNSAFMSRQRPGDGCNSNWIASAVQEHRRLPFDAVIASNPVEEPGFLLPADVSNDHPSFTPNRQWHIPRSAAAMADCCSPVLAQSQHVKLIDPHFKPSRPKFSRPFLAFLDRLRPEAKVDIYRCDDCDPREIFESLSRLLIGRPMHGIQLRLFIRPKSEMHNRFVLGDCGGLSFQVGLDEDDSGGERPEDLVTVLQTEVWRREWDAYAREDFVDQLPSSRTNLK